MQRSEGGRRKAEGGQYVLWMSLAIMLAFAGPFGQASASTPASLSPTEQIPGQLALDEAAFPGLTEKVSLDLRGMDLIEVLKFLAKKGTLNMVTSPDVQGRANLMLTEVSVRDALEILLVSNNLAVERRGTILYIMPEASYEQLNGRQYADRRRSELIQLQYANPGQVAALLSNLKSSVGRIVVDEPTATVALLDVPEMLAQMHAIIERVDIPSVERQLPTVLRTFPIAYANAEEVKAEVESLLTPEVGTVRLDKRSNALIVTELPARMEPIAQLIHAFDAKHRQIYLEATILQITLKDEFDAGIEWQWLSESATRDFPDLNILNSTAIASDVSNPIKMIIGTIAENDVTATIKALHAFGDTEILSSPNIAVMNNEEAKILVGRREAFVTTTVTQAQSTATTAEAVQFVDVGVKLYVTPTISETGFITMKIRPEVSTVATTLTTANKNVIPIVETSEAETKVMVKNGITLIIGGLMKDKVIKSRQKVPLVGDIPLLGAVFRNQSDRIEKTELVILVTPKIISGEEYVAPSAPARLGQLIQQ